LARARLTAASATLTRTINRLDAKEILSIIGGLAIADLEKRF
jgi:hypothetical protein